MTASIELSLVTQVYYSAGKRLLRATVEYQKAEIFARSAGSTTNACRGQHVQA